MQAGIKPACFSFVRGLSPFSRSENDCGTALLLAAGLALLIYFLVCKRRINRAVRGETEARAMPTPRGVAATVAAVVCAACLVALFVLVFGIRRDLAALSERLMASDGVVYRAELAACTGGRLVTLASRFASAYTPEGEMLLP